jgi:putative effector of murein hydrolase LrgA (UPF0299 family)
MTIGPIAEILSAKITLLFIPVYIVILAADSKLFICSWQRI